MERPNMCEPNVGHHGARGMMRGAGHGVVVCLPCGPGETHGHGDMTCGRQFFTKEERTEVMERYKEWLEKETKGVEEAIERLNKE